jgi:hypothetical protein
MPLGLWCTVAPLPGATEEVQKRTIYADSNTICPEQNLQPSQWPRGLFPLCYDVKFTLTDEEGDEHGRWQHPEDQVTCILAAHDQAAHDEENQR